MTFEQTVYFIVDAFVVVGYLFVYYCEVEKKIKKRREKKRQEEIDKYGTTAV